MKSGTGKTNHSVRKPLVYLLGDGGAHVDFDTAIARFPAAHRGTRITGAPHPAWQLLEHLRIAQWDILEFSRSPKHESPDFPAGYWPKTPAPPDDDAWKKSIRAFRRDQRAMIQLVSNQQIHLHPTFPWGDGKTLLREAL